MPYYLCFTTNGILYQRRTRGYTNLENAMKKLDETLGSYRRRKRVEEDGWYFINDGSSVPIHVVGMGSKTGKEFPHLKKENG